MKLPKLLFWCGIAYAVLLLLVRGVFPSNSAPSLFLVGIPLIVVVAIIVRDMSGRSTNPILIRRVSNPSTFAEDPVAFLSGQIRIASTATDSYFETAVRARLKELLITKVALETGMERDNLRRKLSDPVQGPKIVGNDELYNALYGSLPPGWKRISMIDRALDWIGAW
jgi:hypothetical protein